MGKPCQDPGDKKASEGLDISGKRNLKYYSSIVWRQRSYREKMARLKKPLPKFTTEEEEAEFWDKHSPLEFFDISQFEPLQVKIPKNTPITIRLDSNTRGKLEKIASEHKIGLSTFVRKLIIEHIEGRQRSEAER